jgi:hypothetical protein
VKAHAHQQIPAVGLWRRQQTTAKSVVHEPRCWRSEPKTQWLTDALTKLLLPGAIAREYIECAIKKNKLHPTEIYCVASQTSYAPKVTKQSMSSPEETRRISLITFTAKKRHQEACRKMKIKVPILCNN